MIPLYSSMQRNQPTDPGNAHKGLWFDRFFNQYDSDWKIPDEGKVRWIKTVVGDCGDGEVIEKFADRQKKLCEARGGEPRAFKTDWHFATGMGNPHPVENGFAWHPTLGVPYLNGAAVKGLVRAWVEGWMAFDSKNDRLETLYRWFGSEDKDPGERMELRKDGFSPTYGKDVDTEAGAFVFFDAVPLSSLTLACDVMTPHYGKWYEKGGEIQNADTEPDKIPADWHDPVPVPFLVVQEARFLFSIAPRTARAKDEIGIVMDALQHALEYLGAGGKTAVGYGAMLRDESTQTSSRAKSWVDEKISYIATKNRAQPAQTLRGPALAEAWKAIPDAELKSEILAEIERRWREAEIGWGDKPLGGAARKAFEIYTSNQ